MTPNPQLGASDVVYYQILIYFRRICLSPQLGVGGRKYETYIKLD